MLPSNFFVLHDVNDICLEVFLSSVLFGKNSFGKNRIIEKFEKKFSEKIKEQIIIFDQKMKNLKKGK